MQSVGTPGNEASGGKLSRPRQLQVLGILSGFTAGAWLGAAEAPTKLVSIGVFIAIKLLPKVSVEEVKVSHHFPSLAGRG